MNFFDNMGKLLEELQYSFKANEPPVDIYISGSKLVIEVELPGVNKKNISIGVSDNILALMWKIEPENNSKTKFFCIERRHGKFEKFILLPIALSKHDVRANLSNGVLSIAFELGNVFKYSSSFIPIRYTK